MASIADLIVTAQSSVRDALARLDDTGQGVLMLVDPSGQLLRVVTDGDLRRLLLEGVQLTDSLQCLESRPALTLPEGSSIREAMALMTEHLIDHIPVIDKEGRPCDLFHRKELDARIYLSAPHLGGYERQFVEEAFRSNWIAPLGPNVDAFERELAEYVEIGHAAAVSSGTAALHLAMRLLGVGRDDRVFVSTLTFVASANPILYEQAEPVLIDSEAESWNMSPAALEDALNVAARQNRLPKAVIVVSLYGQSADLDPILELCSKYGVPVIEDAAESLGASYKGRASGTHGVMGVYSFNGNKIITTSGGGMLVSSDASLIEQARFLSTQARDPAPHYQHSVVGYNYRMSNVLAGIGRGQLRVLEERVEQRRRVFDTYRQQLMSISEIKWMPEAPYGRATRWLTAFTIDSECDIGPAAVIEALERRGIEARPLWKPMHLQPLLANCDYYPHASGESVSDRLFSRGVCLPSGSDLTVTQIRHVSSIVEECFRRPAGIARAVV